VWFWSLGAWDGVGFSACDPALFLHKCVVQGTGPPHLSRHIQPAPEYGAETARTWTKQQGVNQHPLQQPISPAMKRPARQSQAAASWLTSPGGEPRPLSTLSSSKAGVCSTRRTLKAWHRHDACGSWGWCRHGVTSGLGDALWLISSI
jgi:hypothetical protein